MKGAGFGLGKKVTSGKKAYPIQCLRALLERDFVLGEKVGTRSSVNGLGQICAYAGSAAEKLVGKSILPMFFANAFRRFDDSHCELQTPLP